MYKDPDKQREANRQASKKYRDSMTVADERPNEPSNVIPKTDIRVIPDHPVPVIPSESHVDASDIGVVKALHQAINKPKRGKDIKVFADLPPHVQETIDILSDDKTEHKRRTAIAINYQHLFPDRYHSTGVAI